MDDRPTLLDELRRQLPQVRVLSEAAETEAYRFDETQYLHPGRPLGVCFPRTTEEVRRIVRLCGRHGVPIVPRGAGTGLSGGATAVDGGLTVVFTDMNR